MENRVGDVNQQQPPNTMVVIVLLLLPLEHVLWTRNELD
jgi:hypothetical protein